MLYIGCPAYKNLQIYAFLNEILRLHFFEAVKLRFEGVLSKANNIAFRLIVVLIARCAHGIQNNAKQLEFRIFSLMWHPEPPSSSETTSRNSRLSCWLFGIKLQSVC